MGEMVGRGPVAFQDYDVLIVFGNGDLPFDRIVKFEFVLRIAERFETDDERLARVEFCVNLFFGKIAAFRILPVITRDLLLRRLTLAQCAQIVFRTETGIRSSARDQILYKRAVYLSAFALIPRRVRVVSADLCAFVELDIEIAKRVFNRLYRAVHFAF